MPKMKFFFKKKSILINISGGAAVLQAFGRAADGLLPDLVFSWVTGGQSNQKKPTARLNDEDELLEPRIIAGELKLHWGPNKDSLQTKKNFAKKILCKEKDAKKAKENFP